VSAGHVCLESAKPSPRAASKGRPRSSLHKKFDPYIHELAGSVTSSWVSFFKFQILGHQKDGRYPEFLQSVGGPRGYGRRARCRLVVQDE
jgi:hypothetical protein